MLKMGNAISDNHRRIAKNTGMLYIRMILVILINLYISRIALDSLGITDYGIYGLVSGIIVFFTVVNTGLHSASLRYLTTAMGRNDKTLLQNYYSTLITLHLIISGVILLIGETIGVHYLHDLNIPPDRIDAAGYAFSIAMICSIFDIIKTPFSANIIAHEKMSFYAYISIIDVAIELAIAFSIKEMTTDKLVTYTSLLALLAFLMLIVHIAYCKYRFKELHNRICIHRKHLKEIGRYVVWAVSTNFANVSMKQSLNIFLNIFYGVTLNASAAIMNQVTSAAYGFVQNFQLAINPQLFKTYAADHRQSFNTLFTASCKFSFYLLFLISLPVILCMTDILSLWLTETPPFTAHFCILSLIAMIPHSVIGTLWTVIQASGRIKGYQITIATITLLIIPLFYLILKLGYDPYYTIFINIIANVAILFVGLHIANKHSGINISDFLRQIISPIVKVMIIGSIIPAFTLYMLNDMNDASVRISIITTVSIVSSLSAIYISGLKSEEKRIVKSKLKSLLKL